MMRRLCGPAAVLAVVITMASCAEPPPAAAALNLVDPICTLAGVVSTLAGKVCSATAHPGRILATGKRLVSAGRKLLGGHVGGAVKSLLGGGASPVTRAVSTAAGLAAIGAWVVAGARFAMRETAAVISSSTRPQLQSTWFSAAYWRMAGISALLTLPFLFAAAIQALLRTDPALLWRAAFGYLPLGLLAVAIAAPVTMLLLTASDEMSRIVSSASGAADTDFLIKAGAAAGGVSLLSHSPFLAFVIGLLTAAATLTLWVELLVRSAAVYVIVLMLPLFFAALVWPARRVWAARAVELLVALILSKFAIVAVLSLGGAALGHTTVPSFTSMLAGATLILLAAFSPWALLRILPLHELAAGAAAGVRHQPLEGLARAGSAGADLTEAARELNWAPTERSDPSPADLAVQRLLPDGSNAAGGSNGRRHEDGRTDGAVAVRDHVVAVSGQSDSGSGPGPNVAGPSERGATGGHAGSDTGGRQRSGDPGDYAERDRPRDLPAIIQAPNDSWRLHLGPMAEGEIRPPVLDDDPETGPVPPDRPRPNEDHDPRAPGQEPDGGPL